VIDAWPNDQSAGSFRIRVRAVAPAPVTRSCDAHDDVAVADGMTAEARATVEYLAGTVMIGFGIIFLVVLGDLALGAFIAGAAFTKARIMRLLIPGAVFACGVLLGAWLTRPTAHVRKP
jgi:hypothetical protein